MVHQVELLQLGELLEAAAQLPVGRHQLLLDVDQRGQTLAAGRGDGLHQREQVQGVQLRVRGEEEEMSVGERRKR